MERRPRERSPGVLLPALPAERFISPYSKSTNLMALFITLTRQNYNTRHVKAACKAQFPALHYVDQETPGPDDGSSCGPLVVAIARARMMGRSVEILDLHDTVQLRTDALGLIRKAWDSKILLPELRDDGSPEDDIIVSTKRLDVTSPEHSEETNLEKNDSNILG